MKTWIIIGAANAFLSVAAGAFGAHGLKQRLSPEMLGSFEVGARYQMYHALAIILVAALSRSINPTLAEWACWSFLAGIVLFSGSLYALSMSGITKLGAITPFGGLAFLIGWVLFIVAAARFSAVARGG